MTDLSQTLKSYVHVTHQDPETPGQLDISPPEGHPGIPFTLYGSFVRDSNNRVELYSCQILGYREDLPDESMDEGKCLDFTRAILNGDYRYTLKARRVLDKLFGNAIYLDVGTNEKPLLTNYRRVDQKNLKRLYHQGKLKTAPYDKI